MKKLNATTEIMNAFALVRSYIDGIAPERLQTICDAEREGRLMVLPCEVGGTMYLARSREPQKMQMEKPSIRLICPDLFNFCDATCLNKCCAYLLKKDGSDLGKTVFLTYEEAEAALRRNNDERT